MTRYPKIAIAALACSLLAAACGSSPTTNGGGDQLTGQITISGSSTVEPITSLVAESFSALEPGIGISVDGPGTGDGFELFCDGETDISDASRAIHDEEAAACTDAGVEFVELQIAFDGLTVLTHPDNDTIDCLDFPALYALLGPESTPFKRWTGAASLATELGSGHADDFPDAPLDVTGPGEESGTYDTFVELVIEGLADGRDQDHVTRPDYTSSPNDNVIVDGITGSTSSLGWVGFAFYESNRDTLKAVAVDGGDGCVEPTVDTIADGSYPLARPLFIYVNVASAEANEAVNAFVDYYMSDVGFDVVAETGYVQLPEDAWQATVDSWANR